MSDHGPVAEGAESIEPTPVYLFDLDGTVMDTELLPLIGANLGLETELADLTRLAMDGVIPFETSFRHRVELLKDQPISYVRRIVAAAPLNPLIEGFIARHRSRCVIVTGNIETWIEPVISRLGCAVACSTSRSKGDRLIGLDTIVDKGAIARRYGKRAIAIGDGHNDVEMFRAAGHGIAYGGVHPPAVSLLAVATHAVYDAASLCRLLPLLS